MTGPVPTRLWRVAGSLAIAHLVLMLGGFAFEQSPTLGASAGEVASAYVHSSMTTIYAGGYVEYLGFLVFLAVAALFARLLRGRTETCGWLAACVNAAGVTYVAVTIASGFAAGAASLYDGHHGVPVAMLTAVDDVRNFAFFLSIGALGLFTLAVSAAGAVTGLLPRGITWTGYVVGLVSIAAIPGARVGAVDYVNLAWMVWFLALAVAALRGPRQVALPRESELATTGA